MQTGSINIDKRYMIVFITLILVISAVVGFSYINSDLNYSATVTTKKTQCNQDTLYNRLQCMATFDFIPSKYVSDNNGIDFTHVSSNTNGKGVYTFSESINNTYPIYYYRGAVTKNNAKFAGFCWKIVRTTETGGTKLIYNGTPNEYGQCNPTTAEEAIISKSKFNEDDSSNSDAKYSLAYLGYMYGTVYVRQINSTDNSHLYGNSFTYSNGMYRLSDTHNGIDSTHHYTCFNTTGECSNLSYAYFVYNTQVYYISLANGKSIEDAVAEMNTNTNDSTIKTVLDTWFEDEIMSYFINKGKVYSDYLEDTVWCNDRSWNTLGTDDNYINNGWNPNGGSIDGGRIYFSSYGRLLAGTPSLTCSNKNDSFTVTESATGNGALTYPVGLLTMDEVMLAGGQSENIDNYFYLSTGYWSGVSWWTMSPYEYANYSQTLNFISNYGHLINGISYSSYGVRPSISLKREVKIAEGGDGSALTPYEFIVG